MLLTENENEVRLKTFDENMIKTYFIVVENTVNEAVDRITMISYPGQLHRCKLVYKMLTRILIFQKQPL